MAAPSWELLMSGGGDAGEFVSSWIPSARSFFQQPFLLRRFNKTLANHCNAASQNLCADAPDQAIRYFLRGCSHRRAGRLECALNDFTNAINQNPGYADAFFCRAFTQCMLTGWEGKAEEDLAMAMKLEVKEACQRYNLDHDNPLDNVIEACNEVIKDKPDDVNAFYIRGCAKLTRDLAEAIDDFDEAIAICPEDKRSYYRRGWVKLLQQKEPEANLDFIQGMRRDPAISQPFYRQQFLEICHSNP